MEISFESMEKALAQLEKAMLSPPISELERDGVIQRFEYTIEQLWKTAMKVLKENGVQAVAPREVIQELAKIGWIDNPEDFLGFLKMRNETSHVHKEEKAILVFEAAKVFTVKCRKLVEILKTKV